MKYVLLAFITLAAVSASGPVDDTHRDMADLEQTDLSEAVSSVGAWGAPYKSAERSAKSAERNAKSAAERGAKSAERNAKAKACRRRRRRRRRCAAGQKMNTWGRRRSCGGGTCLNCPANKYQESFVHRSTWCAKQPTCSLGATYETTAPTLQQRRLCSPVNVCSTVHPTEYMKVAPTLTFGGTCETHTECTNAQYATKAATPTTNRLCDVKACACDNGSGKQGAACPVHDTNLCASCNVGYDLREDQCIINNLHGHWHWKITGFSTVNQQGSFPYLHGGGQVNKQPSEEACSNQCMKNPACKYGTFVTASQSVSATTHAFGDTARFGECWLAAQTHAVPVACGVACKSFHKTHQEDPWPAARAAAPNTMGRECTCDPTDQPSTYMSCMATCDAHGLFHRTRAACTCDPAADRSSYTTCTQDPFSYHLRVQHLQPRFHTHALTGGERHRCKMVDNDCKCCDCADDGSFDSIRGIGFGVHTAAPPFLSDSVVADTGACKTLCKANPACKAGTYINMAAELAAIARRERKFRTSSGHTAGTCIISANVIAAQTCEKACESFIKLPPDPITMPPVNCEGRYGPWRACDQACGGGAQKMEFHASKLPSFGGTACPKDQARPCNTHPCVVMPPVMPPVNLLTVGRVAEKEAAEAEEEAAEEAAGRAREKAAAPTAAPMTASQAHAQLLARLGGAVHRLAQTTKAPTKATHQAPTAFQTGLGGLAQFHHLMNPNH
jgi:hypothetical protein